MALSLPPPAPDRMPAPVPAHSLPIDDPERDAAHEALILRMRETRRRIGRAAPTSALGKLRKRLSDSLAQSRLSEPEG